MHVDAEAFVAYQRTDRPDSVVAIAGNTALAVVVLESCSHHEEPLGAFLQLPGAWVGRHQAMLHRQQRRRRFRYRKVRVRSSMPKKGQSGNMGQGLVVAYLNEVLAFGFCDKWLELRCGESVDKACLGDNQKKNLCAGEDRQFVSL